MQLIALSGISLNHFFADVYLKFPVSEAKLSQVEVLLYQMISHRTISSQSYYRTGTLSETNCNRICLQAHILSVPTKL